MSEAVVGRITMSRGPNKSLYIAMLPLLNERDRLQDANDRLRGALKNLLDNFHVDCCVCENRSFSNCNSCPQKRARNIAEQVLKETKEGTHV